MLRDYHFLIQILLFFNRIFPLLVLLFVIIILAWLLLNMIRNNNFVPFT